MGDVPRIIADHSVDLEQEYLPDRVTLRTLKELLDEDPAIARAVFRPNEQQPQLIRARIDRPAVQSSSRSFAIEVRWFRSGDYSIRCLEQGDDTDWRCRWDHHRAAGTTHPHFYHPPSEETNEVVLDFPEHPVHIVLTAIGTLEEYLKTV